MDETVYYAIGDVHGELERLKSLHDAIDSHHHFFHKNRPKTLVHLGDLIDRGPDSFGVIKRLIALQQSRECQVICLRGNHEQMMLDAFRSSDRESARRHWLWNGGDETLESYEKAGHGQPPEEHIAWITELPVMFRAKVRRLIFVHAGVDPDLYPAEPSETYLWTRSRKFFDSGPWANPELKGFIVIHGHTPTHDFEPEVGRGGQRINVDTGAVFGGRLTAAVLAPGEAVTFLRA